MKVRPVNIHCFILLQISYGATDPALSDRRVYPRFFRMVQSSRIYYKIISQIIKYFGWNWVGIFVSDDDSGETEQLVLSQYLSSYGICVDFIIKFNTNMENQNYDSNNNKKIARSSSAQVIIVCGTFNLAIIAFFHQVPAIFHGKTLILNPSCTTNMYAGRKNKEALNKTITIALNDMTLPEYGSFFSNICLSKQPNAKLLVGEIDYWCQPPHGSKDKLKSLYSNVYDLYLYTNPGTGVLLFPKYYMTLGHSPRVYYAIYVMALALHTMRKYNEPNMKTSNYKSQVSIITTCVCNTGTYGKIPSELNRVLLSIPLISSLRMTCGEHHGDSPLYAEDVPHMSSANQMLLLYPLTVPKSRCTDICFPGYRKVPREGAQSCCFDCAHCPEGEISNRTGQSIVVYCDTAIAKANNTSLSFLLLVSIMLTFLCVFLFLGRPADITCMLRQSTFSIIFSIAISCVLGKTTMIYIVFKATKPGSVWKKWVNMKISNVVVLTFSLIQVMINITWLAASPPFQELDTRSYPGKIIVQCNEGSVMAFYSVLGYMGLLAIVSFIIAFLARTLPDSFNEAKYITFSMLVFCSVWIAMIPAYLSTKGKDMVSVEIFAILSSSAGLLGCIFFPKCYIILFRPEMNTKALFAIHKHLT
uniref:G-protein coupled receptors family 3 profile domain-containing protein n=1 Tax=Leptobrachium leishanense TaxID=445787 RepID=A0A8C5PKS3_9ANUR